MIKILTKSLITFRRRRAKSFLILKKQVNCGGSPTKALEISKLDKNQDTGHIFKNKSLLICILSLVKRN